MKKGIAIFLLLVMVCLSGCSGNGETAATEPIETTVTEQQTVETTDPEVETVNPDMRDISTMELVREMGIGINLGNTYEAFGDWIVQWGDGSVESYETAWGSPVILGEYGCPYNNKDGDSVLLYLTSVCEATYSRGMCPILWDTPGGRYDRTTYQMTDPELHAGLLAVLEE